MAEARRMRRVEPMGAARRRLANAVGAAARMVWRRCDLTDKDEVVLDLLCEALARLGEMSRPREMDLSGAPKHIQQLLGRFVALARVPEAHCNWMNANSSDRVEKAPGVDPAEGNRETTVAAVPMDKEETNHEKEENTILPIEGVLELPGQERVVEQLEAPVGDSPGMDCHWRPWRWPRPQSTRVVVKVNEEEKEVKYEFKEEKEEKYEDKLANVGTMCPLKHKLVNQATEDHKVYCDACLALMQRGYWRMHCGQCEYDLCRQCFLEAKAKAVKELVKQKLDEQMEDVEESSMEDEEESRSEEERADVDCASGG